jgi:hypothetical protein
VSGVLSAQTQAGDQRTVPACVLLTEIPQQPPALAYKLQKTTLGVVVMFVDSQVLGQSPDAVCQKGHLDLCGTGIRRMPLVFLHNGGLALLLGRAHSGGVFPALFSSALFCGAL